MGCVKAGSTRIFLKLTSSQDLFSEAKLLGVLGLVSAGRCRDRFHRRRRRHRVRDVAEGLDGVGDQEVAGEGRGAGEGDRSWTSAQGGEVSSWDTAMALRKKSEHKMSYCRKVLVS